MPYLWRKLTSEQRTEVLRHRQRAGRPWHRPPHFHDGVRHYHLTAACYNHTPVIGSSPERMSEFSEQLLDTLGQQPAAWCVLPNHYHLLVRTGELKELVAMLSRFHGRSSFNWNREDNEQGARFGMASPTGRCATPRISGPR